MTSFFLFTDYWEKQLLPFIFVGFSVTMNLPLIKRTIKYRTYLFYHMLLKSITPGTRKTIVLTDGLDKRCLYAAKKLSKNNKVIIVSNNTPKNKLQKYNLYDSESGQKKPTVIGMSTSPL